MSTDWYYGWDKLKYGPVSEEELKSLGVDGKLQPTDTVWKEGIEKGVPAGSIQGLFDDAQEQAIPVVGLKPALPSSSVHPTPAVLAPVASVATLSSTPGPEILPDSLELVSIPEDAEIARRTSSADTQSAKPDGTDQALAETPTEGDPDAQLEPEENSENQKQASATARTVPVRKKRVTGIVGIHIVSQDGTTVRYKKKCPTCGFEAASISTMRIRSGVTRQSFFCSKCRKQIYVSLQGSS